MWKSVIGSIVLLAIAFEAQAAERLQCGPRKEVVDQLAAKFGERPVAIGLSDSGRLVEVLAGQPGGTFTVIVTTPQGVSCIVLAGDAWQARLVRAADPEA